MQRFTIDFDDDIADELRRLRFQVGASVSALTISAVSITLEDDRLRSRWCASAKAFHRNRYRNRSRRMGKAELRNA